mgnify:CR=1 FL=1
MAGGAETDGDAADVVIPLDVGDEHQERRVRIGLRSGNVLDDFLEQGDAVLPLVVRVIHEIAVAGRTVAEGSVELFFVGIQVVASDSGPGIDNKDLAMRDGYSTKNSLGLGLPGARRLMDDFALDSEVGRGTTVTMKKWKR